MDGPRYLIGYDCEKIVEIRKTRGAKTLIHSIDIHLAIFQGESTADCNFEDGS